MFISGPKGETGADGGPGPVGPIGPQGAAGERYLFYVLKTLNITNIIMVLFQGPDWCSRQSRANGNAWSSRITSKQYKYNLGLVF